MLEDWAIPRQISQIPTGSGVLLGLSRTIAIDQAFRALIAKQWWTHSRSSTRLPVIAALGTSRLRNSNHVHY